MVEKRSWLTVLTHVILILGVIMMFFPIYLVFVASTHTLADILDAPMPLLPGSHLWENYSRAFTEGSKSLGASVSVMLVNSLIMATGIAVGKIVISLLAAYAFVFFRFRFRSLFFWTVFITLMLPVEVRILPTYKVIADLHLLNSYTGLILPLIASATATFFFRQYFLSIPSEIVEAARVDGAGPMRFLFDILIPMSRTSIAAMFVILFIYGWNQYLWPLLITTEERYYTLLIGINRMLAVGDQQAEWQLIMATTLLAMAPPVFVVIGMQSLFIRGMTESEK